MQRAVFIAVLSFLFFLAMMLAFYLRQNVGYFMLASVFLVIYLLTMFSWVMKRRNVVEVYENGLRHGKRTVKWSEISRVRDDGVIEMKDKRTVTLPTTLNDLDRLIERVRSNIG